MPQSFTSVYAFKLKVLNMGLGLDNDETI